MRTAALAAAEQPPGAVERFYVDAVRLLADAMIYDGDEDDMPPLDFDEVRDASEASGGRAVATMRLLWRSIP